MYATRVSIFSALFALAFFLPGVASAGWYAQTSGVTANLYDVDMGSATAAVAVGAGGTVIYTTNRGMAWAAGASGTSSDLQAVDMVSATVGYAVGGAGLILKTADGGATWSVVGAGTTAETLHGIKMYSSSVGYVVGASGTVLRTTDSGATWSLVTSGTTSTLYSVDAISTTSAWAVGDDGTIIKTSNGTTWSAVASGLTKSILGIDMITGSTVHIVGNNLMHNKTADTGATWTSQGGSAAMATAVGEILAYNASNIMTLGTDASAMVTADGGTTWTETVINATNIQYGLAWYAQNTRLAVGASGSVNGYDITAPTVSAVTPITATEDTSTAFSVTFSDDVAVSACEFYVDGLDISPMTLSSGTATVSFSPPDAGTLSMYVTCTDPAGNVGTGASTTVTITAAAASSDADTTAPTVSAVTPTTATEDSATTLSATYSDDVSVTSCTLNVAGTESAMTLSSGTASASYTFSTSGSITAYVTCVDAAGNEGAGAETTITVAAATTSDTTAPTVSSISPTSATSGVAASFTATYSDDGTVASCNLLVDGTKSSTMALSAGTASASVTFNVAGSHTAVASCVDAAGNTGTGTTTTITVASASSDTTGPTVSAMTPTTATQDTAVTFSVTVTDDTAVYGCSLFVEGSNQGTMTASGSAYSRSYTFATSGTLTANVRCADTVGNETVGATTTITVAAAAVTATDTTAPTVGALSPDDATAGTPLTLSASVADSGGMGSCVMYVNSAYVGVMQIASGYATYDYTFDEVGTAIGNAYCTDAAGNATRGASTTFTVEEGEVTVEDSVSSAEPGSLIKLPCSSDADANDMCRAVYYYDTVDLKRHAFPNEAVFFSWYQDYTDLIIVDEEFLYTLTLGGNVTYRPGVTMVKFISVNTVYAVGESGELRAIDSEETATDIYGSDWNQMIDDISDAFYSNYEFGEDIEGASDYDADDAYDAVDELEDIL